MNGTPKPFCFALCVGLVLAASWAGTSLVAGGTTGDNLPSALTDAEFRGLMTDLSEPAGFFGSDNFTSNEASYAPIVTALRRGPRGGVYLGVGPEQNFSYIAATQPQLAFIVDIRRSALLQHLMYKALFELAENRVGFLSLLFSKPIPSGLHDTSTIADIWNAFWFVDTDSVAYARNYQAILNHLAIVRGIPMSRDDSASLLYVYEAFYRLGPRISFDGYRSQLPISFATLTLAADGDSSRSFLASEATYRIVRDLHRRNLIVPVVGDFAGPKAIRAIGKFLMSRQAAVTTFYVSSVEGYLFRQNSWQQFYANVAELPIDGKSVFVRPPLPRDGSLSLVDGYWNSDSVWISKQPSSNGVATARMLSETGGSTGNILCPISTFIHAWRSGRIMSLDHAVACIR